VGKLFFVVGRDHRIAMSDGNEGAREASHSIPIINAGDMYFGPGLSRNVKCACQM
jgi:hypothetical protein